MATLTYRDEPGGRGRATQDVRRFFERMRKRYGRRPLVAVIERGKKNGRLHIHLALNFYVPKDELARLWGKGHVDIRKSKRGQGRWRQRELASYLSKYITKDGEAVTEQGPKDRAEREHRYLVTQGFTPKTWRLRYDRVGQARERLVGLYGQSDMEFTFGNWELGMIYGIWYSFPDHVLHPPPGTLAPG